MQTARVIEFPTALKESIKLALREASDLSYRQSMNSYIKQLLRFAGVKETSVTGPGYKLQIHLKRDGELLYDIRNHEAVSPDGNCPRCNRYFMYDAALLYIHPGLQHDKAIFACRCGSFYAYYAGKEG